MQTDAVILMPFITSCYWTGMRGSCTKAQSGAQKALGVADQFELRSARHWNPITTLKANQRVVVETAAVLRERPSLEDHPPTQGTYVSGVESILDLLCWAKAIPANLSCVSCERRAWGDLGVISVIFFFSFALFIQAGLKNNRINTTCDHCYARKNKNKCEKKTITT